jgi:flavin-dependent dehydrogenase
METKILVGADGPMSTVAARANLKRPSNMMQGVQMTITAKDSFDPNSVELFFTNKISPDFFGWVVPISEHEARIGVATKKNPIVSLKHLIEKRTGGEVSTISVRPDVAGKINFGLMEHTSTDQVLLVGDAAAQVKPFSGGGIVYGLIGAGYAANAIIKALRTNDFSEEFFRREYDKEWKDHLATPIKKGLLYQKAFKGSDGTISDFRANSILGLGNYTKSVLESFDGDLL